MGYSTHRTKIHGVKEISRYRLYADGTVVDTHHGNVVAGFILGVEFQELFHMRDSKEKQERIIANIT